MKRDLPILTKWRDQAPAGDSNPSEQFATAGFRSLKPVPRSPREVTHLLNHLVARAEKGRAGNPRLALVVRTAIAVLVLGSFGGALAAVHLGRIRDLVQRLRGQGAAPLAMPTRQPRPVVTPPAPLVVQTPEVPLAPIAESTHRIHPIAPTPAPSIAAPSAASPAPAPIPGGAGISAGSSADDSLAVETSLIDKALAALGQHHPQEALGAVAAYRQQFAQGRLEYEADLAEVKAQVALGKDAPALAVLDRAIATRGFGSLPRSPDVSLLRAELLARTGDCPSALPAFSQLLAGDLEAALQERAVYGRAICLGKLGQRAQSRAALRAYLNRFPQGRFVEAAQDALDPLK